MIKHGNLHNSRTIVGLTRLERRATTGNLHSAALIGSWIRQKRETSTCIMMLLTLTPPHTVSPSARKYPGIVGALLER